MQEHADHTEVEANKAIYELGNYYTGIREGLFWCGPPQKLDICYHLHVLNTRLYRAFCQATFGRFIDHEPFWSDNVSIILNVRKLYRAKSFPSIPFLLAVNF